MKSHLAFACLFPCILAFGCGSTAPGWINDPYDGMADTEFATTISYAGSSPRYPDDLQAGRHYATDAAKAEIASVLNDELTLLNIKRDERGRDQSEGESFKRGEVERFVHTVLRGARPVRFYYDPSTNTDYVLVKMDLNADAFSKFTEVERKRLNNALEETAQRLRERRKESEAARDRD
jgi:hypothetical protein